MKVNLIHTDTGEIVVTADVDFGLDNAIVNSASGMAAEEFKIFLETRSKIPQTYEMDDIVLEALQLTRTKRLFGRMSEACMLYAIVKSFAKEEDDLEVHPVTTELVSMLALNPNYGNIYIWKPWESRKEGNGGRFSCGKRGIGMWNKTDRAKQPKAKICESEKG
jgi:hypothetical protein